MPGDGRQLDELLSGFIDGELADGERELVEKAARDDVRIAQQIESLRRQSSWLRQIGQVQNQLQSQLQSGKAQPRRGIAEAVVSQALQRSREMGLPATHHVRLAADRAVHLADSEGDISDSSGDLQRAAKSSTHRIGGWLALGGLAAAAAVLVAVTWPQFQQQKLPSTPSNHLAQDDKVPQRQPDQPSVGSTNLLAGNETDRTETDRTGTDSNAFERTAVETTEADRGEANAAAGSNLVGVVDGLAYALVVDVELSAQAAENRVLEKLLTSAGISLAPPVAVNGEILKALDDSRLVVREPTSTTHAVSIQVVRSGLHELDGALRRVWLDYDNFPNVGLNLSIDSRAALMREMLRSSGDRFTPTDHFALPLTFAPTTPAQPQADVPRLRSSPLMAADAEVQYISSSQRENGWESLAEVSDTTAQSLATILLVIHFAN